MKSYKNDENIKMLVFTFIDSLWIVEHKSKSLFFGHFFYIFICKETLDTYRKFIFWKSPINDKTWIRRHLMMTITNFCITFIGSFLTLWSVHSIQLYALRTHTHIANDSIKERGKSEQEKGNVQHYDHIRHQKTEERDEDGDEEEKSTENVSKTQSLHA